MLDRADAAPCSRADLESNPIRTLTHGHRCSVSLHPLPFLTMTRWLSARLLYRLSIANL